LFVLESVRLTVPSDGVYLSALVNKLSIIDKVCLVSKFM